MWKCKKCGGNVEGEFNLRAAIAELDKDVYFNEDALEFDGEKNIIFVPITD